ncbi:MAG: processive 1,2-diacylglycerol beta-glucosyltransferase [Steroidobacteraceae bacterium]|nr:processive 1,2-diacylglycerol beta-glucosyltransferase [Steroidobacteraceae bacterium]
MPHNGNVKGITSTAAAIAPPRAPARASLRAWGSEQAPRVLLLTSGLGCGHLRAAEAVEQALLRLAPGATVRQLDFWTLMNPGVAAAIQSKYLELVLDNTDLYARLHGLDERTWRRVIENDIPPPAEVVELIELVTRNDDPERRSMSNLFEWALGPYPTDLLFYPTACAALPTNSTERAGNNVALLRLALLKWAFLRLQGRMEQRLLEFGPDAIVATQMVPAALVSALKKSSRRWRRVPVVGVLTDFGAHDYWAQPGIDRYCVPHESITGPPLVPVGQATREKLVVTGVPLMPGFETLPDRADARRALGLDAADARPVVLVLGGGLGLGLDDIVEPLCRGVDRCHVVVMAGRNAELRLRLARHGAADGVATRGTTVSVYGWTEHMERFLVAADIVVGKSGGLTVAEVLACGRPLLVTRTLQGQESFNVRFLERHGIGRLVGNEQLAAQVREWLERPELLQDIQARAAAAGRRDGALRVAEQALERAAKLPGRAVRRPVLGAPA